MTHYVVIYRFALAFYTFPTFKLLFTRSVLKGFKWHSKTPSNLNLDGKLHGRYVRVGASVIMAQKSG